MQLNDLDKIAEEHEAGRWFELLSPVDGKPTGIKLKVAGPDSERQRKAGFAYQNALTEANRRGKITAERADDLYVDHLADFVVDLDASEDGKPVPFSKETVTRIIRAGRWVRAQLEQFAQERVGGDVAPQLKIGLSQVAN
ncbi:MAG: hypothetical protein J0I48_15400 [Devosia sp.]|uniref:hypothetical protein n=1 Tax=Devosia sp. 66-22 TaxID=1895753 RepID=UPI00092A35E2|nr:hypothetical protein [Devosia sp. 66-22]MBN9347556.1 hypothetical protein [Devosia sp.]OJX50671.1 MAG: hypothetical protein BGO81_20700 [Devosia sp. 66-22]